MSSRDGMVRADVGTGLFDGPKVKRLARLQKDPVKTAATMSLYVVTMLDSWAENEPVAALDAMPGWWIDEPLGLLADLVAVGLLDAEQCIPAETLDRHMEGARARVAAGAKGAAARWGKNGKGVRSHSGRNANSPGQTSPVQSRPVNARGREGKTDPRSLKQILAETTGEPNIVKERRDDETT